MIDLLVLQIWIVSIPANKDGYVMDGNVEICRLSPVPGKELGTTDLSM